MYINKCTTANRNAGEMAVRQMSATALIGYDCTDPLTIYEYDNDDRSGKLYAVEDCDGVREGLTFDEAQEILESFATWYQPQDANGELIGDGAYTLEEAREIAKANNCPTIACINCDQIWDEIEA